MFLRQPITAARATGASAQRRSGGLRPGMLLCAPRVQPCNAAAGEPQDASQAGPGPSSFPNMREFSAYTSAEEWKKLDSKVNKYPCMRSFQAIGVTDPAFKSDMVAAVSSVVGTIHVECVSERPSKGGKYTAVRIGPVHVQNSDQVIQIFEKIKEAGGSRLKWYM